MPYYSSDLIEEVISQNDIVDTVSEYVTLKKSGRNYMGLCPFHKEKSPSFCVSLDKQIFKCFGCSEGGNVISFLMKIENLDFWDAVEVLAERANIDTSRYIVNNNYNKGEAAKKDLKDRLLALNKDVALFYHNNLIELLKEEKNDVKDYIMQRKFDSKTINTFGIGYATGKIPLYDYLKEKGYTKEEMLASGIILENSSQRMYDRYYQRVIFPIFDIRDRVIGFGGRALPKNLQDKRTPKYVNSPENDIYHKGRTLYLMNFAKREKLDNIIIVEGYMDAISLQKFGFPNAVASLGTALTENQARLIKKYTDNVIIGYDQDEAGQEAIMRGLDILAHHGLNVKVLKLDRPDAKDPDEYLNKYGPERLRKCIDNAISLVEFKVEKLEKNYDPDNFDSKVRFLTGISSILSKIDNNIERDLYIDKISKKYGMSPGPILQEVEKGMKNKRDNDVQIDMNALNKKMQLITSVRKRQEQYIIALLMCKKKKIVEAVFENIKLIKEITDIMYIDISGYEESLLQDVLKNKKKEKLFTRRDEIIARLNEDISSDESEILKVELNQIIIELSRLK